MKRIQLINLLFIASLVFSFTACKTSSDVMSSNWIQKRKYNKGFYVSKKVKTENDQANAEKEQGQGKEQGQEASSSAVAQLAEKKETTTPEPTTAAERMPDQQLTSKRMESAPIASSQKELTVNPAKNSTTIPLSPIEDEVIVQRMNELSAFVEQSGERTPNDDTEFLLLIILAIVLPPLAVFLMYDISNEFWLSILLTLLFWLPGIVYALYLVFQNN